MLYAFLIAFAVLTIVLGLIGRGKVNECKTDDEKKAVKAKWQLIGGLMGIACIIIAGIIIFTMF